MRHKKAIFLGSTVVMTAAMVIFAQEPVRRAAQSHRHADGHLQQMKQHQLTHAATQHGSAPKPADPAPFFAPPEAKKLVSAAAEAAPVDPALVGETYEDVDSDPALQAPTLLTMPRTFHSKSIPPRQPMLSRRQPRPRRRSSSPNKSKTTPPPSRPSWHLPTIHCNSSPPPTKLKSRRKTSCNRPIPSRVSPISRRK